MFIARVDDVRASRVESVNESEKKTRSVTVTGSFEVSSPREARRGEAQGFSLNFEDSRAFASLLGRRHDGKMRDTTETFKDAKQVLERREESRLPAEPLNYVLR